jgi:hypothetical protein
MLRPGRESPLSEGARELRSATRIVGVLAGMMLFAAFAAFRRWIAPELGGPFVGLFAACALTTVWFGAKAHKRALEDREKESGRAMIVAIAAQLGRQDDAALERIKAKGGPAGEAAGMILMGRAEKLKKVRSEE